MLLHPEWVLLSNTICEPYDSDIFLGTSDRSVEET